MEMQKDEKKTEEQTDGQTDKQTQLASLQKLRQFGVDPR